MQRNWIGRSEGARVQFPVVQPLGDWSAIEVFTTRIDTIFGANAIILAPEHPLLAKIVEGKPQRDEVLEYREATRRFQRRYLLDVLTDCDWNIAEAQRRLGIARSQIYNLISLFELKRLME